MSLILLEYRSTRTKYVPCPPGGTVGSSSSGGSLSLPIFFFFKVENCWVLLDKTNAGADHLTDSGLQDSFLPTRQVKHLT